MSRSRKIAIIHYRVGRTDGVSLEIEKRKRLLGELGHDVKLVSGPVQQGSDFVIDDLEFDKPHIVAIKENSFNNFGVDNMTSEQILACIDEVADRIKKSFLQYYEKERFDILLLHNIFSHGRHIAAAKAFAEVIEELDIPVIATNHDYYWERKHYQRIKDELIEDFLNTYVPFDHERITYININTLAQQALIKRREIYSQVFGDVFDFHQPAWKKDDFNEDFLDQIGISHHDLVVLQATRIVERKGIELAVDFVRQLTAQKKVLEGKKLYNGKNFGKGSEVVFVLAGYVEHSARMYVEKIRKKIKQSGIKAHFVSDMIGAKRRGGINKKYSLWDAYVYADIVTYPSLLEGWGNQFIEAIFAKKPLVLFEYPVFEVDIKREGYFYISLGKEVRDTGKDSLVTVGSDVINRAVSRTLEVLTEKETVGALEKNFVIGKKFHDDDVLRLFLDDMITRLTAGG